MNSIKYILKIGYILLFFAILSIYARKESFISSNFFQSKQHPCVYKHKNEHCTCRV